MAGSRSASTTSPGATSSASARSRFPPSSTTPRSSTLASPSLSRSGRSKRAACSTMAASGGPLTGSPPRQPAWPSTTRTSGSPLQPISTRSLPPRAASRFSVAAWPGWSSEVTVPACRTATTLESAAAPP